MASSLTDHVRMRGVVKLCSWPRRPANQKIYCKHLCLRLARKPEFEVVVGSASRRALRRGTHHVRPQGLRRRRYRQDVEAPDFLHCTTRNPLEIAVEASNTALSCSSSFAYSFVIALRSRLISACISENRSTMISTR